MQDNNESKNLLLVLLLNLFFAVVELIGGIYSGSFALVSDAFHDFGDTLVIASAVVFNKLSTKNKTRQYPFGFKKYKLISSAITSLILLIGAIMIIKYAVGNIFEPNDIKSTIMIFLACIGIITNVAGVLLLNESKSRRLDRAIMFHLLEDLLGWIAVLFSAIIIKFTGLYIIDPILSICISLFIGYNAIKNLKDIVDTICFKIPKDIDIEEVTKFINQEAHLYDNLKIIEQDDSQYILLMNSDNCLSSECMEKLLSEYNIFEVYYIQKKEI